MGKIMRARRSINGCIRAEGIVLQRFRGETVRRTRSRRLKDAERPKDANLNHISASKFRAANTLAAAMKTRKTELETRERKRRLLKSKTGSPLIRMPTPTYSTTSEDTRRRTPQSKPRRSPSEVGFRGRTANTPPMIHEAKNPKAIDLRDGSVKREEYLPATLLTDSEAIN